MVDVTARYIETLEVEPTDLQPYPGNAKLHDGPALIESVETNGQFRAVLARRLPDGGLQLLAGHGTTDAIKDVGGPVRVEVVEADDDEARRIVLADNALGARAGYDEQALLALLDDANAHGGFAGTGYDEDLYKELLDKAGSENPHDWEPDSDPDDIPEVPEEPVTKLGDVWTLGNHVLVCGDCRDPEVMATLMDDKDADLVLTDPPYGVIERTDRKSKGRTNLTAAIDFAPVHDDDEPFDPAHLLGAHKRLVVWGANHFSERVPPSPSWIVWDKLDGLSTDKRAVGFDDNADAELAWSNLGGPVRIIRHRWKGMIKGSEQQETRVHPTQKPVALMVPIIEWRTEPGDTVLDLYAGSGPVLLACEATGRIGRAAEIAPGYCDVIARRWQALTRGTPLLNGEPIDMSARDEA